MCVSFIIFISPILGTLCTCLRHLQANLQAFSTYLLQLLWPFLRRPDGDPLEEVQAQQRNYQAVWCVKSCRFMRDLGRFQAACKLFSVDAGLAAICRQLSGVWCTRQASGFQGNFKGFEGELSGATLRHSLQQVRLFADNFRTFQIIRSDSGKLRTRQALSAMASLGQYSGILCESWSQLSTSRLRLQAFLRQQFTFWVAMGQFLVQLVSAPSKQGTRWGGVV